jgi:hypothetical protein
MDNHINRMRKALASIASIEVDWVAGLISAQEAMTAIAAVLHRAALKQGDEQ